MCCIWFFISSILKIKLNLPSAAAWPFCSSMLCQRWRKVLKTWCNNRIRLPPLLVVCKNTVSSVHLCRTTVIFMQKYRSRKKWIRFCKTVVQHIPKHLKQYAKLYICIVYCSQSYFRQLHTFVEDFVWSVFEFLFNRIERYPIHLMHVHFNSSRSLNIL